MAGRIEYECMIDDVVTLMTLALRTFILSIDYDGLDTSYNQSTRGISNLISPRVSKIKR